MKGEFVIRSALEGDFPPLCALYCDSVRCNRAGFIQDLDYHGCLIAKTRLWRQKGGDMLVAREAGAVIGMGALAPEGEGCVELCKLHVDIACQGRGIGRRMVERLIELAAERGFAEVKLHVTVTQKPAIKLYQSIGFQPTGEELFESTVFGERVTFPTLHMHLPLGMRNAACGVRF
jgi:GNAT superfamily N-acetyltransferase